MQPELKRKLVTVAFVISLVTTSIAAQEPGDGVKEITIGRTDTPPLIVGLRDDAVWKDAVVIAHLR